MCVSNLPKFRRYKDCLTIPFSDSFEVRTQMEIHLLFIIIKYHPTTTSSSCQRHLLFPWNIRLVSIKLKMTPVCLELHLFCLIKLWIHSQLQQELFTIHWANGNSLLFCSSHWQSVSVTIVNLDCYYSYNATESN